MTGTSTQQAAPALGVNAALPPHCRLYMASNLGDVQQFVRARQAGLTAGPTRLLLSYFYCGKGKDLDDLLAPLMADGGVDIFIDSGGFSAFTCGKTIDLDDYIAWCRRWKHWITVAAVLDVIGDSEGTARNAEKMLEELDGEVKVLPAFHVGSPWSALERWVGEVDHMALGGMVPYSNRSKLLTAWLDKCFEIIPPHVKIHGFGHTIWRNLKRFPFNSVDSSSWSSAWRFGTLNLFDVSKGCYLNIDTRDRNEVRKASKLIWSYGLSLRDVTFDNKRNRKAAGESVKGEADENDLKMVAAQAESWRLAEEWLVQYKGRP